MANGNRDECKQKSMINENADKKDQNIRRDDDDQGEAIEND